MTTVANDAVVTLDVRPVLANGAEPFTMIMEAAAGVPDAGALELTAPFEPVPLYAVLSRQGFGHVTAALPAGDVQVRFVRTGITPAATVGAVHERYPDTAATFAAHGIDLCCGGGKTLEFVSQAHGVELARLLAELQQAVVKP